MSTIKYKQLRTKFIQWFNKNRKVILIVGGISIVAAIGIVTFIVTSRNNEKPAIKIEKIEKTAIKYYSPLTGSLVENKASTTAPVTGVMIENSPDARPQSGLKDSGVVFEAIAEGGITRFLVLYQSEKPQLIGPVRSLRLYDVEWLAAFNAGICHVGGSAAALAEVRNGSYRDLDQFFNPGSYWRASDKYAPHNVYTSFDRIDTLNSAKGYESSAFTGFSRIDGKASDSPDATNVDIVISGFLYNSQYIYDAATNTYARSQGGGAHVDRELGQITPNVVVAMWVDETTELEDGYRENITTIGSGEAVIFQNGMAISATWHKPTKLDQITFTDSNGNDVPLVRGQTWIIAVPNGRGGVTWN